MSAKPIEVKKDVKEVKVAPIVAKVEASKPVLSKEDEALARKVMSDSLNSEKAKKDVQLFTVAQLESHLIELRAKFEGLAAEYNQKNAVNSNLGSSIQSAHSDLANARAMFERKNAEMLADLQKRLKDAVEADKEYQALTKSLREKQIELDQKLSSFNNERESNFQQVQAMQTALDQNNAEWKRREADILLREEELKKQVAEFDLYKDSLKPEMDKIDATKNENTLLLKKVEMQNNEMERRRVEAENSRQLAEEARLASLAQVEQARQRIQNEEGRLRKWEQDLKDEALDVRVQQEAAQRVLRREQLQREVAMNDAKLETKK